jgi:hypothetical protein
MASTLLEQIKRLETLIKEQERDGREAFTINDFCALENISRSTFQKWQRMGIAPRVARIPGMVLQRIAREDYKRWKKRRAKLQLQWAETVEAETAARVERATTAGRISARSPRHVSKQRKASAASPHHVSKRTETRRRRNTHTPGSGSARINEKGDVT